MTYVCYLMKYRIPVMEWSDLPEDNVIYDKIKHDLNAQWYLVVDHGHGEKPLVIRLDVKLYNSKRTDRWNTMKTYLV